MQPPTAIHGESGIDGTTLLPQPLRAPDWTSDAIEAMATAILGQPAGTAYLVATGSFTNIALLIRRFPRVVTHIKGLSVMGGVFGDGFTDVVLGKNQHKGFIGNYTPWAEFNIVADPEAAAAIFSNTELAAKTIVIPLDLSHQVLATQDIRDLLLYGTKGSKTGAGKTTLRRMLVDLLFYFAQTYADVHGITAGPPLHDPLAVAAVLRDTEYEIPFYDFDPREEFRAGQNGRTPERFSVSVATEGSYEDALAGRTQTGRTSLRKACPWEEGVTIPRGIDTTRFWQILEECIERADAANKAVEVKVQAVAI